MHPAVIAKELSDFLYRGAIAKDMFTVASGGYGTQSANASSGGSGEGEPQPADDEGAAGASAEGANATGATGETETDWLRSAKPDA